MQRKKMGRIKNEVTLYEGGGVFIFFVVLGIIGVLLIIWGQQQQDARDEAKIVAALKADKHYIEAFKGQHMLQKMREEKLMEGEVHASFGFFTFYIDGKISDKINVLFSWEYTDPKIGNLFVLDRMYYQDIMVKFENIGTPTIEFNCKPFDQCYLWNIKKGLPYYDEVYMSEGYATNPLAFLTKFRTTALIRCKPEHWPKDIQIPLTRAQ
jgi:hypothetical protein